jgi:hypothetical protein
MTTEAGMATAPTNGRKLATIAAARPLQIEWLERIAAAAQRLRPHVNDAVALGEAVEAIGLLHAQLRSPKARGEEISLRWLEIISGLLTATIGMDDRVDTGEIVDIFSQLIESCGAGSASKSGDARCKLKPL